MMANLDVFTTSWFGLFSEDKSVRMKSGGFQHLMRLVDTVFVHLVNTHDSNDDSAALHQSRNNLEVIVGLCRKPLKIKAFLFSMSSADCLTR